MSVTYHFFPVIVFALERVGFCFTEHVGDKSRDGSLWVVRSSIGEFLVGELVHLGLNDAKLDSSVIRITEGTV